MKAVSAWLKDKNGPQVFRLFGFAGTGKSTLARHLAKDAGIVCYAAFTGKAAMVMKKKGCKGASTIHALIYSVDDRGRFRLNPVSPLSVSDLCIIDEVSMVGEELGTDLMRFGKKILVLGDPFQLPPVGGETGFFVNNDPDIMLTDIHRQAADNPIIRMSIDIREGRALEYGTYGESRVIRRADVQQQEVLDADQVIVGRNLTRQKYNVRLRQLKGFTDPLPMVDDKLVCLKNDRPSRLLNGQLWRVLKNVKHANGELVMSLTSEDFHSKEPTRVVSHKAFFGDEEEVNELEFGYKRALHHFTYGYALTCHKCQGSQWDNVFLFDESAAFRKDSQRHLYTAVTRAAERITVVR